MFLDKSLIFGRGNDFIFTYYIMPFVIRKIKNKNLYSVKNLLTGTIHSKGTTHENALAQVRLLHMLENPKKKK